MILTTTFQDIFKSSFLENIGNVSLMDMVLALLLAFALGLFIFFVYKKSYAGVMYSAAFGVTLIVLAMISTLIILAVSSNIVLSLGMVGALSIVRFRTAIKEPSDIAFLFWSIAVGIVLAAGLIVLAVFGSIFIGGVLLLFSQHKDYDQPYILVLHCDSTSCEQDAYTFIEAHVKRIALKSKSVAPGCIELNYEVRLKESSSEFFNMLVGRPGISHAVMVSYNGDYMS